MASTKLQLVDFELHPTSYCSDYKISRFFCSTKKELQTAVGHGEQICSSTKPREGFECSDQYPQ